MDSRDARRASRHLRRAQELLVFSTGADDKRHNDAIEEMRSTELYEFGGGDKRKVEKMRVGYSTVYGNDFSY